MQKNDSARLAGPGFLLSAAAAWAISAAALVLVGALLLRLLHAGEETLAYVSAAVSFLAAYAAGRAASSKNGGGSFAAGLISGATLCIVLLTVGFLINGRSLDASAVLSVASFTLAGALSGALLYRSGKRKHQKTAFAYH
ncbi:MAG: TIGR04086 family membrane protein [Oscillospiraceae bacterium]|nr:TIGR04086 family membrane protein [Oscillospiraceae bacterium]